MAFTHLHMHTEYSLLDGAARIKSAVAKAKDMGMTSLAITDHGVMFGVVDFYKECKKQGIKAIIGCEVYTAARTLRDKDPERDKRQGHLILLAKNEQGYKNLIKIVSTGYLEGFYYKPRIDKSVLREHSEGIIALSACLSGNVQRLLLNGDYKGAKEEAAELLEIFGSGSFYLEVQDHGLEAEAEIYTDQLKLSEELGIPMVATNDVHYITEEDAKPHDVLLAIQTGTTLDDEKRMRYPNDQFYLKSEEEMRKIFFRIPEACDNTQKIADQCNVDFKFGEYHLPEFKAPDGKTNKAFLRELCEKGLKERYGEKPSEELRRRLDYELTTIESMGYVEYFLIVWDFINYAREHGIMVGPGRGSGAGSIVAYCIHITNIDPIKYNLIFERFLNPERVSMPDFDIDFCYERRQEVIDYVTEKYGKDRVSQIITFGTMKAKQAVRDVGRVMGVSYQKADAIAKAIPFELKMTIEKALAVSHDFSELYENDDEARRVIDMAMAVEGAPRHASIHAAGVVISKLPVDEYVPLYLSEKGPATQFTMTTIEELGLLKMDFLGLRNLTVIRDAVAMIEKNHGVKIDFDNMEYDDAGVYEMIAAGNTDGVFQLESSGMTQFMKNLKPTCFEDIVAGISLYRPGPMDSIPKYIENKKNPEKIEYVDRALAPILDVTYGCLVYQEQVMQIVRDLGGYSYGRSDLVRRAMSKKKMDVMLEEKEYFINGKLDDEGQVEIAGCVRNGVPEAAAEAIFNDMVSFAEYAFNKSHAAAYAVVGYETGYLKRYYPVEFMAALMSSVMGDAKAIAKYIRNCADMKIEVLPPSVNTSQKKFSVEDGRIRFGLLGVKNVGEAVIDAILEAREEKGVPKDFFAFVENLDISRVNKKAVESLIKAGACDELCENRAALLAVYESTIESAQNTAKKNVDGQLSIFQLAGDIIDTSQISGRLPKTQDLPKSTKLEMEKDMLGVYLTDHPLNEFREKMESVITVTAEAFYAYDAEENETELRDLSGAVLRDGTTCVMAGMVTYIRTLVTKKGTLMAFVNLEDLYGVTEIVVFPNTYDECMNVLNEGAVVAVKGTVSFKEGESPKLLANQVISIEEACEKGFSKDGARRGSSWGRQEYAAQQVQQSVPKPQQTSDMRETQRSQGIQVSQGAEKDTAVQGAQPVQLQEEPEGVIKLRLTGNMNESMTINQIKNNLKRHRGTYQVVIYLSNGKALKTERGLWAKPSPELRNLMIGLLGQENVKM